jgi:MerR family transcriptional regulator/heat shock protein HspR
MSQGPTRRRSRSSGNPANQSRGLYVISVAAELVGVHPQTLRDYERKGLLEPSRTRGGSRRYSASDIARLVRILELTEAGVNLEGVRRILDLEEEVRALRETCEQLRRETYEAVEATHRKYRRELVPLRQEVVPFRRRSR